jgi:hypothetical protein
VPASNWVKSTTLTPCRKLKSWLMSLTAVSSRHVPMLEHSVPLPAPRRNAFPRAHARVT